MKFRGMSERWLVIILLLAASAYAIAEDITLTTYYPSPRGVYDQLRSVGQTLLAQNGGAVGIGMGTASPKTTLDVRGALNLQDGNNAAVLYFPNTGTFPNLYIRSDDDPSTFEPSSERLFVGANGNVTIAAPATSPSTAATLLLENQQPLPTGAGITIRNGSFQAGNMKGELALGVGHDTATNEAVGSVGLTTVGAFNIMTGGNSRIQVDKLGNVGIGTPASPVAKLDVAGTAQADYLIVNPQNTTDEGGEIRLDGAGGNTEWILDNWGGRFRWHHGGAEYATLTAAGNLGLGTANPNGVAPPNGAAGGNLNVNDVYLRSANGGNGGWATQVGGKPQGVSIHNLLVSGAVGPHHFCALAEKRDNGTNAHCWILPNSPPNATTGKMDWLGGGAGSVGAGCKAVCVDW